MNSRDGGRLVYLFDGEHGVCDVDQPHGHIDVTDFFIDDCPLVGVSYVEGLRMLTLTPEPIGGEADG